MNAALVAYLFAIPAPVSTPLPSGSAAQSAIDVTITDSAGNVYPVVELTGAETPPFTFSLSCVAGPGTAEQQAVDINGANIGSPVPATFVAPAAGTGTGPAGGTYLAPQPGVITVTAAGSTSTPVASPSAARAALLNRR